MVSNFLFRCKSSLDKYEGVGYKYEIEEANNCILEGKLQSETASHKTTLELAEIMDEVRKQINLVYPFEQKSKL